MAERALEMERLLIVDDMPVIVDGLAELFVEKTDLNLEIFRAYSGIDALDILEHVRIDVVLTDVRMPIKSGIDLLKAIRSSWPRCKVIFLTSFNNFDFAREAISNQGFDYILKTEGDDRIVGSVTKALEALRSESESEAFLGKAMEQYNQVKPILRREYLTELIEGRYVQPHQRKEKFANLDIRLDPDSPVGLVLIRLDAEKDDMSRTECARRLCSVQNIMEENLGSQVNLLFISSGWTESICFLQPDVRQPNLRDDWDRVIGYVFGTLETVQSMCDSMAGQKVSFIIGTRQIGWDDLSGEYLRLETMFNSGIGLNSETLITDAEMQNNNEKQERAGIASVSGRICIGQYACLAALLNNGQECTFNDLYMKLSNLMRGYEKNKTVVLEAYHMLSSVFFAYINRWDLPPEAAGQIDIEPMSGYIESWGWQKYSEYFHRLAGILFRSRSIDQEKQTGKVIKKIREYIDANLSSDLSLTSLGRTVHLNSSYLSRLYKQSTGVNLTEYITEIRIRKAQDLLAGNDLKIHEIASKLGYSSGMAFARFFKKIMGITPQEYRERAGESHE